MSEDKSDIILSKIESIERRCNEFREDLQAHRKESKADLKNIHEKLNATREEMARDQGAQKWITWGLRLLTGAAIMSLFYIIKTKLR